MASRLLLHIGTEKTGTTAWQSWLAGHRTALDQLGYAVPQTLGQTNHRKLPTSCFDLNRVDDFVIRSGLGQAKPSERQVAYLNWQRAFISEVQQRQQHTWLVSSEHFSSRLTSSFEVDQLHTFLKSFFGNSDSFGDSRSPANSDLRLEHFGAQRWLSPGRVASSRSSTAC